MARAGNLLQKLDLPKIILICALVAGLFMRVHSYHGIAGPKTLPTSTDSEMYDALARHLIAGHGYVGDNHMIARDGQPTAFYGPVYPFYLTAIYYVFHGSVRVVQISHIILALITAVLIYLLGKRLFGELQGAIGAFVFATSPQIIHYNLKLLSETLYIFLEIALLLLLVVILTRDRPSYKLFAASGLLFGITYLCRQTIFVMPVAFLPLMWVRSRENGYAWLSKATAVFLGVTLLVLSPWVVRNYIVFHEVMLGTTTGPATLWWGTIEEKGTPLSVLEVRYRNDHPGMNEVQMSHLMSKEAQANLRQMTVADIIHKIGYRTRKLFGYPGKHVSIYGRQTRTGMLYSVLGALGLIGLFIGSRRRYDRLLAGLFVIAALGLHIATHAVFRYVMPAVPLFALGLGQIVTLLQARLRGTAAA